MKIIKLMTLVSLLFIPPAIAKLDNKVNENQKQFGYEIKSKQFSDEGKNFSGKKVYHFPLFGWMLDVIYRDGRSFSESARPKGDKVKKYLITEKEANIVADVLYPKKERGAYRKQIKNANFISHFFERGVVSYEMVLDKRRKNHIGVKGIRAILYSEGEKFKDIMVNAYH